MNKYNEGFIKGATDAGLTTEDAEQLLKLAELIDALETDSEFRDAFCATLDKHMEADNG